MREPELIHQNEDKQLVPMWSIVLAAAVFALVEYYFWLVFPQTQHHIPPLGLRIYLNVSWGLLAALYFVMPGGIGAVFCFLLRQPLVSKCPACGTHVQGDFHFCPQCNYQLTASCGNCFRTVRATDHYCTRCGHELDRDQLPARLRVTGI